MKHRNIAIDLIDANPDQPRKDFDPAALQELADSIRAQGLIQPISVRPIGDRFQIIAGERRYRAHKLLGLATIPALVQSGLTDRDVALQAIIENACRRDVNIMEEADAYGQLVRHGLSNDEIASQVGVAAFRVEWRLSLLNLKPDYQHLARVSQISPAHALELAKLDHRGQDELFKSIKAGVPLVAIRAKAAEIESAALQLDGLPDCPKPSVADQRLAASFEAKVRKVLGVLNDGTVDGEITALQKVDPGRAATLADLFNAMQSDLRRIEQALRDSVNGPLQPMLGIIDHPASDGFVMGGQAPARHYRGVLEAVA